MSESESTRKSQLDEKELTQVAGGQGGGQFEMRPSAGPVSIGPDGKAVFHCGACPFQTSDRAEFDRHIREQH